MVNAIQVNRAAPAAEQAKAVVHAPIEVVWDVLSDLGGWPKWNRSVSKMEVDGPVEVGTSFEWVAGGSKIVSRLEEMNPPRRMAWSGKTLGIRAIHVWEFESRDGGTLVRTEESFEGAIVRVVPWLMRSMLKRALEGGVQALKAESEARHSKAAAK